MDTAKARKHMVDSQVRPNDVTDFALQGAMLELPRERFVPADKRALAYVEQDVPLFDGRWLLKARDFSKLINEANIQKDDLVLDIGCGFGYSTAVLSKLASVVVAVEEDEKVASDASERIGELGLDNAVVMQNALTEGCPAQAPYDVIVIAGGVETNLEPLLKQLKEDVGRLVTIKMDGPVGHAMIYTRSGDAFGERRLFEAHPAGVIPGFKKAQSFQF